MTPPLAIDVHAHYFPEAFRKLADIITTQLGLGRNGQARVLGTTAMRFLRPA